MVAVRLERGYAIIEREWQAGDTVTLELAMLIERMTANPRIREDAGRVALQRGPVVYCLEEVDNGTELASITLPRDARLSYTLDRQLFGGVGTIRGAALCSDPANWGSELYRQKVANSDPQLPFILTAIPYCFWANRQPGEMRVWIRES